MPPGVYALLGKPPGGRPGVRSPVVCVSYIAVSSSAMVRWKTSHLLQAIHTYEGTETIQTLLVGRDITGVGAFT